MWSCLRTLCSARSLITSILDIQPGTIEHLPFAAFGILFHGFLILSRVVALPSTLGWDQGLARREATLDELASLAKRKLVALHASLCDPSTTDDDPNPWGFLCKLMDSLLSWHKKHGLGAADGDYGEERANDPASTYAATARSAREEHGATSGDMNSQRFDDAHMAGADYGQGGPTLELSPSQWDDMLWQTTLDELSFFAPTQPSTYSGGAFAPWSFP